MIRALLLVLGLALSVAARAEGGDEAELLGSWVRATGETQIEISRCGDDYCAVNVWVRDADVDEKVGDVLVMSLKPKAPGRFEGEAYDRRRDTRFAINLTVTATALRSEGCVLVGLICKSADWNRP
jgi:uncharacterized protein (DUF2147 family)